MKNLHLIYIPFCLFFSLLTSCSTGDATGTTHEFNPPENGAVSYITHYNIIITPDLSNRLGKPKPVSDTRIVGNLLQHILPRVLNYKRTTNQQDKYSVSFVSNQAITQYGINVRDLKIDFNQFERQIDRIDYIKDRNPDAKLKEDKDKFISEFNRITEAASKAPDGADLWTYFNQGINNNLINSEDKDFKYGGKNFTHRFRNIMVLLTDGYIEAGLYGKKGCDTGKQCYYLSSNLIKSFRDAYRKSGEKDMNLFFEKNNYGIVPANNPNLKNLEVLVLQMEDRSLDKAGNATQHPTDMKIMELFWTDWLTKSGVKRFDLKPILASEADTEKAILNFIGVK